MAAPADPVTRARSLAPLIREHADAAERARRMPAAVADAMARLGLYRIAAPTRCGGEAVDPMLQIATIEAVATIDGSCAWNLMIGIENHGLIGPNFEHCADLLADPLTKRTAAGASTVAGHSSAAATTRGYSPGSCSAAATASRYRISPLSMR
jgi:alkylation response protein AidB-like acyl-CoA dehydrogenase